MKKIILLSFLCIIPFLSAMELDVPVKVKTKTYAFTYKGKRKTNEDRYVITKIKHNDKKYLCTSVFDGHAGSDVAQLAQDQFFIFFKNGLEQSKSIQDSFGYAVKECEELAKEEKYSNAGATVLASCFDQSTNQLHFCSLGDSRASVFNCYKARMEDSFDTVEHNCTNENEKKRVRSAGGTIYGGKLNGMIEVTRSLGDAFAKTRLPLLIAEPEFAVREICKQNERHTNYRYQTVFSIEASDGFWNAFKEDGDDYIVDYIWDAIRQNHHDFYDGYDGHEELVSDEENDHEVNIAQRLCYLANATTDNITIIFKLFTRCSSEESFCFSDTSESSTEESEGDESSPERTVMNDEKEYGEDESDIKGFDLDNIDPTILTKSGEILQALKQDLVDKEGDERGQNDGQSELIEQERQNVQKKSMKMRGGPQEENERPTNEQGIDIIPGTQSTQQSFEQPKSFFESLWKYKRHITGASLTILLLTIMAYNYYKCGWSHCITT